MIQWKSKHSHGEFIARKKMEGSFNKKAFIEKFGTRLVAKPEFIDKAISLFNIEVVLFNDKNKKRFDDIIYTEYMKIMGE